MNFERMLRQVLKDMEICSVLNRIDCLSFMSDEVLDWWKRQPGSSLHENELYDKDLRDSGAKIYWDEEAKKFVAYEEISKNA